MTTAGNESNPDDGQLSFFDHLDELRSRLLKAAAAVLAGCVLCGAFVNDLMNLVLLKPATDAGLKLQNLRPFGQPFLYFKVIFVAGIVVAFPFVLHQVWRFVAPGLYDNERRWARTITAFTTICFLVGISFAYFVMLPNMLKFSVGFGSEAIANVIDVNEYFSFIVMTILGAGLIFELPMITFVLASIGLVTAAMMRTYHRHAIVVILILAAVLTPSPDPINQLIFAIPLYVLYLISIGIAGVAGKAKAAKAAERVAEPTPKAP
jgi:sec-independent protein translocase protein TatC